MSQEVRNRKTPESTGPSSSKKPKEGAFYQQTIPAWQPIMTPRIVIGVFIVIGIIFIPVGVSLMSKSDAIYDFLGPITYDNGQGDAKCPVNSGPCTLKFKVEQDVNFDLNVYYQLTNYYQNHRVYVSSRSTDQLQGKTADETKALKDCTNKVYSNTSQLLYPCGLIANSFFTDTITISTHTMVENGISWPSDKKKFYQVEGFDSKPFSCSSTFNSQACTSVGLPASCKKYQDGSSCYLFYYPDDNKVQYLYETYPNIISPIKGVTDEHFMVWMRTAALPTFRKLYGIIPGPFKKGDVLLFSVNPRYEVKSFGGTKALIVSTVGQFGGKNVYLGAGYVVVGGLSLLLAIMFVVKNSSHPREMGDAELLTWSQ